jgi:hypothetical protein
MDHKFTEQIKDWLEKPEAERDYTVGALYLLKLSGNQIMYKNIIRCLDSRKQFLEYQLQKYYNFRVQALTHAQVEEMSAEVETIAEEHALTSDTSDDEKRTGKRADHDSLPNDIKAKFVENLSILQRMRELHLRLRTLSLEDSTCPDSERYPFLKELITLDKKLHANWEAYDHYVAPDPSVKTSATPSSTKSLGSAKNAGSKKKSAK